MADQLNLYFDTVAALGQRYGACKESCLAKNPTLKKEIDEILDERKKGQRTRYFDPMNSDACLSECRAQFYFVFKRFNRYLEQDNGFYIESSAKFDLNSD